MGEPHARGSGKHPRFTVRRGKHRIELPRICIDGQGVLSRVLPCRRTNGCARPGSDSPLDVGQPCTTATDSSARKPHCSEDTVRRDGHSSGPGPGLGGGCHSKLAGQGTTEEFLAVVGEMQSEELRLLVLRTAKTKRLLSQTGPLLFFATALGLLIAAGAGLSVERDSSRRALAEVALRESERKYRTLIQGVREYAILMLGPQGEIRSWNPGAERMTGCTQEEITGHNFSFFFSPDDVERGRPEEILRLAAASGQYEEQGMRVRKNGSRFMVQASYTAARDPNGELRGFSVISRDLSESKESEARYRGLLEAAPEQWGAW